MKNLLGMLLSAIPGLLLAGEAEVRAETLFAKLRGESDPAASRLWGELLASPAAAAEAARAHLRNPAENDRGLLLAMRILREVEGAKAADELARQMLEARREPVRLGAREQLAAVRAETPDRVVLALKEGSREIALRALDYVKSRPDEKGLFGIVVAIESRGYGGGGPKSNVLSLRQDAYVKDYTVVVAPNAVGYDPEIAHATSGSVLEAKVLSVEELRTAFYEVTGIRFDTTRKAAEWWALHKSEVLKRIEEHPGR